jgi:hypothetical protein
MKREFIILIAIGVLNLILFTGVFRLFHSDRFYSATLGKISQNYERSGEWDDYQIRKVSKPFIQVTNENLLSWDAGIYQCIKDRMYTIEDGCYGNVRAAFFPLFPMLWKVTGATPIGISIINYLLFITSLALLVVYLYTAPLWDKLITYSLLLTLPSVISYHIPYSESLFMFTTTLAVIGLLKKRYWLYFTGMVLLAMVRPASVFVFLAIVLAELVIVLREKDFRIFIKDGLLKTIPFLTGLFFAILIQYLSSGSWAALFEAREYWSFDVSFTKGFSEWSLEGFGLSSFAMIYLCLPAIGFIFILIFRRKDRPVKKYVENIRKSQSEYLFLVSLLYLLGIFAFTLATQGLNLHSFSRYALASPLFYIAVLLLLNYLSDKEVVPFLAVFLLLTVLLSLFLILEDFGGSRLQFPLAGLYLFILTAFFLVMKRKIPLAVQLSLAIIIILLSTVWNTYLLNDFMSNGWIFT